jgi:hypothetical protein
MRKFVFVSGVVMALSGCAGMQPAQTRQEFVQKNLSGTPFSMVDAYVTKRRFDDVVNSLKQKTAECFNVNVTTRRTEGPTSPQAGTTTMNVKDEYRTTVRVINANRAELTTQFTSKGIVYLQTIPEGGFYHRAIDIERLTPSTTKLTYYGSSFDSGKKAWAAIKEWSDGKATPCP